MSHACHHLLPSVCPIWRDHDGPRIRSSYCSECNAPTRTRCNRCHMKFYCSRRCQRLDWKDHRAECARKCFCCLPRDDFEDAILGYVRASREEEKKHLDHLRSRLCSICANDVDGNVRTPLFARTAMQKPLTVAYWNMWADVGADMCATMGECRNLLEYCVAEYSSADEERYFSPVELETFGLETFQELVMFYLSRFPHIALEAHLPNRLPKEQWDFYRLHVGDFIRAVEYLVTDVLSVRILAPLVVDYLMDCCARYDLAYVKRLVS